MQFKIFGFGIKSHGMSSQITFVDFEILDIVVSCFCKFCVMHKFFVFYKVFMFLVFIFMFGLGFLCVCK